MHQLTPLHSPKTLMEAFEAARGYSAGFRMHVSGKLACGSDALCLDSRPQFAVPPC